jgi:phospholipid transport system substrate-binding protein
MRDLFAAINLVLADPRTDDQPLEKLKAIRAHVDTVFDFREAAMLALGREWTGRTPVERDEFVALFADLLERSFVWRLAGKASLGDGLKVQYLGETVTGDTATVDTAVASRDGKHLRLDYRMVRRVDRWLVRDVVMDGVSTMENYRAQFHRVVRDGSWRDLMAQLRARVGAPAGEAPVAAAPLGDPAAVAAAPVVPPLAPSAADGPATDERHAAARDVAAVVTPGHAARDVAALPAPRPRRPVVAEPASTPSAPRESVAAREPGIGASPRETSAVATSTAAVGTTVTSPARLDASGGVTLAAVRAPGDASLRATSPAPSRPPAAPVTYWVQVGAFRNAQTARRTAAHVKGEILAAPHGTVGTRHAEPLLRVRVGPFKDRAAAAARLRELQALGYQPFLATN